ncbi:hypothetical protein C8Q77DRAFT_1059126 [Trametes polyzona]|nr:hypothetical protein C8Q77DRAFT_1059126 [Trametes polyzona]
MLAGFVKALPRVRFLVFDTDATLYPPKYLALTAQYPITSLSIWDLSIFPSWSSLFDFIWAFPYLANLRIGSHIDGLPGEGTEEPLSILKASRLSAIANRGRCRQLRTLHLEASLDIWFLCPAFPPKGVFGCSLESLTLRVGERASSIETLGSRFADPFCHLFQMPTLRTVEIAIVPKRLGLPSRILGRHTQSQALQVHKDMAEKLSNIVRLMRLSRCEVRELRIRFKLLPTRDGGVPLHFHHTYLFQQYFGSGLQEAVESLNSALSLQQLRICLPLNGLPPPCDTAAWWESQLRAHLTRLKVNVSVNLFRMYPSLDPDDSLPSTWYCHRHAGWVTLEMCSAACFAVPILKPGNPLA